MDLAPLRCAAVLAAAAAVRFGRLCDDPVVSTNPLLCELAVHGRQPCAPLVSIAGVRPGGPGVGRGWRPGAGRPACAERSGVGARRRRLLGMPCECPAAPAGPTPTANPAARRVGAAGHDRPPRRVARRGGQCPTRRRARCRSDMERLAPRITIAGDGLALPGCHRRRRSHLAVPWRGDLGGRLDIASAAARAITANS